MLQPLEFVPPDSDPIWHDLVKFYDHNPVTIEEDIVVKFIDPQTKYSLLNASHLKEMLTTLPLLQVIDMGDYGKGVTALGLIQANQCILPITGRYYLAGHGEGNDKTIHLKVYEDFFEHGRDVMLHQTGLFSLIQHAPNADELTNYFDLSMDEAETNSLATENLWFDQQVTANFLCKGQVITLPFPMVRAKRDILPNTMLAYCYGDRFWQKQICLNPNNYFRCFHSTTYRVLNYRPVRRAFWFEISGKPIRPLLIDESDIGQDIELHIGMNICTLQGRDMLKLIKEYPYATMLRLQVESFYFSASGNKSSIN